MVENKYFFCIAYSTNQKFREVIPVPDSLGEEAILIDIFIS